MLPQSALQCQRLQRLFLDENQTEIDKDDDDDDNDEAWLASLGLKRVHSSPHIYTIDNFLSEADLQCLEAHIHQGGFQRSFVDNLAKRDHTNNSIEYDTQHRTSSFVSFEKRANARVAAIERKASELLGAWNSDNVEPLQLVRYRKDEFFGRHHDLGDLDEETGAVSLPPKNPFVKRRLATLFCYINDVPDGAGGETFFPTLGVGVQPKRGRAVLFSNVKLSPDKSSLVPDERTVHEGSPVVQGIKYGLNVWITED